MALEKLYLLRPSGLFFSSYLYRPHNRRVGGSAPPLSREQGSRKKIRFSLPLTCVSLGLYEALQKTGHYFENGLGQVPCHVPPLGIDLFGIFGREP